MTESVRKVVALFDLHSDDAESLAQAIDEYLRAARAQDAERIRELEGEVKAEQTVSEARRVALCQFRDERDAALAKFAALEREMRVLEDAARGLLDNLSANWNDPAYANARGLLRDLLPTPQAQPSERESEQA